MHVSIISIFKVEPRSIELLIKTENCPTYQSLVRVQDNEKLPPLIAIDLRRFFCILFSRFKITSRYDDDQASDGQSSAHTPGSERGAISQQMQQHQQYLGDIAAGLPELPDVEVDESEGMSWVIEHDF